MTERLYSWKEIAGYLKHGVRTVQRWERTQGLPVHRRGQEKRDAVYAYPVELDAWWTARQAHLKQEEEEGLPADVLLGRPPLMRRMIIERRIRLTIAIFGIIVLAGVGFWGLRSSRQAVKTNTESWIVITDLDNQTGEAQFDEALTTAFRVRLQGTSRATVLSHPRLQAALEQLGKSPNATIDEAAGRQICLRERANLLFTLTLARVDRGYGLTIRMVEPKTGRVVRSYFQRARDREEVLQAATDLSSSVRRDIEEGKQ